MQIRELADRLIIEIQNKIKEFDQLELKSAALTEFDVRLNREKQKIEGYKRELFEREEQIRQEKLFIEKSLEEMKKKEALLSTIDGKRLLLQQESTDIKKERDELHVSRRVLEDKQKKYEALEQKERELTRKEELIKKSIEVEVTRKEELDLRERMIIEEAARLQRIAERYSIKK